MLTRLHCEPAEYKKNDRSKGHASLRSSYNSDTCGIYHKEKSSCQRCCEHQEQKDEIVGYGGSIIVRKPNKKVNSCSVAYGIFKNRELKCDFISRNK